jgi:hypothetical protein
MTFWDWLTKASAFLWTKTTENITKILGFAQVSVSYLCGANVIPEQHLKVWFAASGLLTIWCGFGNSSKIADKVVSKLSSAQDNVVSFFKTPGAKP